MDGLRIRGGLKVNIGRMDNNMETIVVYYGFRVQGLGCRLGIRF